jgi:hypothetical protein
MRARRLLTSVVLAVLVLCVAASPSLGAAAANGTYAGKTAQGFKLRARIAGKQIFLVRVKVKLRCHDGGLLYDDLSDFEATPLDSTGAFTDVQFGPSDEVKWKGQLKDNRVHGIVRVTDKVTGGVQCDSGSVGFTVSRAG